MSPSCDRPDPVLRFHHVLKYSRDNFQKKVSVMDEVDSDSEHDKPYTPHTSRERTRLGTPLSTTPSCISNSKSEVSNHSIQSSSNENDVATAATA